MSWLRSKFLCFLFFLIFGCFCEVIDWKVFEEPVPTPKDSLFIKQGIIITRHGDRSPTHFFRGQKSFWQKGKGQLTEIGEKQLFELGQKFRRYYVEQQTHLNSTFVPKQVFVQSTPKERTLQSAQSFLLGFFPPESNSNSLLPFRIQTIPIFSSAKSNDSLLYAYKNCARLKQMQKEHKNKEKWLSVKAKHLDLLQELSQVFQQEIDLKDVTAVLNLLNGEIIHDKEKSYEPTEEKKQTMKEIAHFVFRNKFPSFEFGRLGAGNLVGHIASSFSEFNSKDPKMKLFSAHDGTLFAVFAALNLTNTVDLPRYASYLLFELLQEENTDRQFVRIVYNDKILNLNECEAYCPLEKFVELTKFSVPENWEEECSLEGNIREQEVSHLQSWIWALNYLAFFFAGALFILLLQRAENIFFKPKKVD